jgi:hypothetical protein
MGRERAERPERRGGFKNLNRNLEKMKYFFSPLLFPRLLQREHAGSKGCGKTKPAAAATVKMNSERWIGARLCGPCPSPNTQVRGATTRHTPTGRTRVCGGKG